MISFQTAKEFLLASWHNRRVAIPPTVFLVGPPGIGKSSVPAAAVKEMGPNAQLEVLDLTSRSPEDIGGLPFRDGGQTKYSPQEWAVRLSQPDAIGCLVFDDLPAATSATAAAVRQVVLDRRLNGVTLSPGVLIVVTGNRREDQAYAITLPSHFRNAVCIMELEPQFDPWAAWFIEQGGDPAIIGFLRWRPNMFSTGPGDADTRGRFATPRSWTMLSSCLPAAERARCVSDTVAGYVGEGVAVEFMAYRNMVMNLPPISDVFANPQAAIPNPKELMGSPDKVIAITTGLSHHAVQLVRAASSETPTLSPHRNPASLAVMQQFFGALSWMVGSDFEHGASAIVAYSALGGSRDLLEVSAKNTENPHIASMLQDIRSAVAS